MVSRRPTIFRTAANFHHECGAYQLRAVAWGYDEATDEFLCYDSKAPEAADTIGNTRYHADLLTSALPWWGTYALTMRHSNESRSGPGTRRAFPVHYVPFLARNGAILGVTRA